MAKRDEIRYRGYTIRRSSIQTSLRWHVVTLHASTGVPYAEEFCPQFGTLASACEWVREHA